MGKLTEQQQIDKDMKEWAKDEAEYDKKVQQEKERIRGIVLNMLGQKFLDSLNKLVQNCELNDDWELVARPVGDRQVEDCGMIKKVWVEQAEVGDSGDSFQGAMYVTLKRNLYLKMNYSS